MNLLSITFQVEQLDLLLPVEPGSDNSRRRTSVPPGKLGVKQETSAPRNAFRAAFPATAACPLITWAAAIGLRLFPVFLLHPLLRLLRTACSVCFLLLSKPNGCLVVTRRLDRLQCFRFELGKVVFRITAP